MNEPELADFDPKADMQQMAAWMLDAADYAEIILKSHPKKPGLCKELRHGAASIALLHGQFIGALHALRPVAELLPEAAVRRQVMLKQYTDSRAHFIEKLCEHYVEATIYYRQVQHGPGRPKVRLPDYERFEREIDSRKKIKMVQYAYEFGIAVELVKRKSESGQFYGLRELLADHIERGLLDDVGDTEQRIKRLARNLHKESPIYLTDGLREARRTAMLFIYSTE